MTPMTFEKALSKAAHLCSQAEKAPQDIYDKLLAWGVEPQQAEQIVEQLKEEKFLDEGRYAHAFVHDKFEYEHWGKLKILYQLRQKGISEHIASCAIDDVITDEAYVATLADLLRAKMRGMSQPLAVNDKAKLFRFSSQRGYDSRTFALAMKEIGDDFEGME